VKAPDIRLEREKGGGVLWDIGIYCVNAARMLFRAEPVEALCLTAAGDDPRFREVEESASVVLRFPGERLASFTSSFGAADGSRLELGGTKGTLALESPYGIDGEKTLETRIGGRSRSRTYRERDQFAPELVYFSDCVLRGERPEPSGEEGMNDVRIIEALYRSAERGAPVRLEGFAPVERPEPEQAMRAPPVREPELVHVAPPEG
jgi:predicted dehydrogenase